MTERIDFQQEVVNKVVASIQSNISRGYIYLPLGVGRTAIITDVIERFLNDKPTAKILVLQRTRMEAEQFSKVLFEKTGIVGVQERAKKDVEVSTYHRFFAAENHDERNIYSLIIMIDSDRMPMLNDKSKFGTFSGILLGVFSHSNISADSIFFNAPALYLYNDHNTRFTEYWYINNLIIPMLQRLEFSNIETEKKIAVGVRSARVDIIALNQGIQYIFEIKAYRSAITNQKIIQNAIYQIQSYKNALQSADATKQCFGLILLCHVDREIKKMLWEKEHIFLWDIENLLYLCNSDPELLNTLSKTIPYSLGEFSPEVPFGLPLERPEYSQAEEMLPDYHDLIKKLTSCKQGKGNSAEYEKICAEIIKYLFETEFSQFSEQHKTRDSMFRMDILCALKGTTAFWQMLTHYYNTKFVVFEFKNYTKKLQQNLIYVTDKYLFNPALRNVAFIISRNGFDKHAHDAAMGILKESGKLIVDLTDDDLIKMIVAKTKGEEPSDYLLNKVELLLMSVSV